MAVASCLYSFDIFNFIYYFNGFVYLPFFLFFVFCCFRTFEDKVKESEESAKTYEEKFKKIKIMYAKLRDEHVNLLRMVNTQSNLSDNQSSIVQVNCSWFQHGDNKRCLDAEKKTSNELKTNIEDLHLKMRYLETTQQERINEYEQRITDKSNELLRLEHEIKESQANSIELKKEFDTTLSEYHLKLQNEIEINQKLNADASLKQNEQLKYSQSISQLETKSKVGEEEKGKPLKLLEF